VTAVDSTMSLLCSTNGTPLPPRTYWRGGWSLLRAPEGLVGGVYGGKPHILLIAPKAAVDAGAAAAAAAAVTASGSTSTGGVAAPNLPHVASASTTPLQHAMAAARFQAIAAHPKTLALACADADSLSQLHAALARSRSTMQAVAGLLQVLC
jgi:hypothetical protein